jgi:hypothetical protein
VLAGISAIAILTILSMSNKAVVPAIQTNPASPAPVFKVEGQIDPNGSYNYDNESTGCTNCEAGSTSIAPGGDAVFSNSSSNNSASGKTTPQPATNGPYHGGQYWVGAYTNESWGVEPEIYTSVVLPNIGPRAGDYYVLALSAYESNLRYDQIGIMSDYKACAAGTVCNSQNTWPNTHYPNTNDDDWYVFWVNAPGCGEPARYPVGNPTGLGDFIINQTWQPNAFELTQGETFTLDMKLTGSDIVYSVYKGLGTSGGFGNPDNPIWSYSHWDYSSGFDLTPTTNCNGTALGYTLYEEVHNTSSQQFPNWPFNFTNNKIVNPSGSTYADDWHNIGTWWSSSQPGSPHGYVARMMPFQMAFVEIDNEAFGLYSASSPGIQETMTIQAGGYESTGPSLPRHYGPYCVNYYTPEYMADSYGDQLNVQLGYTWEGSICSSTFWVNVTVANWASQGVYPIWVEVAWSPGPNNIVEYTSAMIYVVVPS